MTDQGGFGGICGECDADTRGGFGDAGRDFSTRRCFLVQSRLLWCQADATLTPGATFAVPRDSRKVGALPVALFAYGIQSADSGAKGRMSRKFLSAAAKIVFTCLTVGWALRGVNLAESWHAARMLAPILAVTSCLFVMFQVFLGAVRWQVVMRALGLAMPFRSVCAIYASSTFFSMVLPGGAGGDAVRIWMTRKAGLPMSSAFSSVILERAVTVLGLILLVTVTEPLLLARFPDLPVPWAFPALSVACLIGFGFLCLLDRLPLSLRRWSLVRGLAAIAVDARTLLCDLRRFFLALAIAILGHANLSLAVYALAVGLGLDVRAVDCLALVPPVILVATLPISIAGWGVRETAMVAAFALIGIAPAAAFAVSVLYGLVVIVASLPGGIVWLMRDGRAARLEEEAPLAEIETR